MCAEDIFRATLEELAKEGNEKAKLALVLAEKLPSRDLAEAARTLINAQASLSRGLMINGEYWSRSTDTCILNANDSISRALVLIK